MNHTHLQPVKPYCPRDEPGDLK